MFAFELANITHLVVCASEFLSKPQHHDEIQSGILELQKDDYST